MTNEKDTSDSQFPEQVSIPRIDVVTAEVTVIGDAPLIVHRWSEKAQQMIADKQQKKATKTREAKNPQEEFEASLHRTSDGRFGFPASGFKGAMVGACRFSDIRMTEARGAFHVDGDMVVIEGPEPTMREDMVRIGRGIADIRYRGQFWPWGAKLRISYNTGAISLPQIVNLLNLAGFGVGVGEWRPEKDGSFGRFHVQIEGDDLPS